MKKNYHIFKNGELRRKDDTLVVKSEEEKNYIPVNDVEALYVHSQLDYNTRLFNFLNKKGVQVHIFGWNNRYCGSFISEKNTRSGKVLVKQVEKYKDAEKRLNIASKIVKSSIYNMKSNVMYYNNRGGDYKEELKSLENIYDDVDGCSDINELMSLEANSRKLYYSFFSKVTPESFTMSGRNYNPPENELNALISYGNSIIYSNVISALRKTSLDLTISYLHEPGERRLSLCLDIADIFKPTIVDRTILRCLNRKQIDTDMFEDKLEGVHLSDEGSKILLKELESTLETTIEHPELNRKVSYQYLIRLDGYSLKKHILTGEKYEPFKKWW